MTRLTKEQVCEILEKVLLIRLVEDGIVDRYGKPGEHQEMRCPVHLSIGQEAAAVGACFHLRNTDRVFSTHRCHAHYLAKGGDVKRMVFEIYGKLGGCLDGRGGSMHLMDDDVGMTASVPIVSSSIPLAVGSALADKLDGNDFVSVAFFGDASTEEGVFHESANFAGVNDLPVIFVCENNLYSVYTHISERQPERELTRLADAHGVKSMKLDGNDVFEIQDAFQEIINQTRQTHKPTMVVMDTYRWREHCGVNYDDHLNYRNPEALPLWKQRDPVELARAFAINDSGISANEIAEIEKRLKRDVNEAFEAASAAALPTPEMAERYVYA